MIDPQRWQRLSPLLDVLPDLAEPEQQQRLAMLHERDPALAVELASMLASARRVAALSFLDGSVGAAPVPQTLVGRRIGAYVIEEYVGEGSSASVWRARRHAGLAGPAGPTDEVVALKLLHLSRMSPVGMSRFRREGLVLSRMRHSGIARLIETGVSEQGQPFLALEFVQGQQIDAWCNAQRLDVGARLALVESLLAAVAYTHEHNIIHRDIKPNNILVSADGAVKLLDFGIAKALAADPLDELITVQGQHVMTPEYAAPEQVSGGAIDVTTDVYAVGVLLSQLITGRRPVARKLPCEDRDLAAAVQTAVDRRTTLAGLRRQLKGLRPVVERCLRDEPEQRYASVEALAAELRRHRLRMRNAKNEEWVQ